MYLVQPLIWSRLAKRGCQWMRQAYSEQLRRTQPRNFQEVTCCVSSSHDDNNNYSYKMFEKH